MEKRMQDILSILQDTTIISSAKLADRLEVSSKTIRSDIKKLNQELAMNGAIVHAKPNAGITLDIHDAEAFSAFLTSLKTGIEEDIPNSCEERIAYIIDKLMESDAYIKKEDLAEELYISISSLTQDLKEVKAKLEDYNLHLEHKPNFGFRVTGTEFDMRLFITNLMLTKINREYDNTEGANVLKYISSILDACFAKDDYHMSDVAYQNLIVHIYIALKRVEEQCYVPLDETTLAQLKSKAEYTLANEIVKELQHIFHIELPESEIGYITIHLVSKKIIDSTEEQENIVISDEIYEIVTHMLNHIYEDYKVDLRDDLELRFLLALHLVPMDMRVRYNMVMKNPMLKDIKTQFTYAYNLAVCASDVLIQHYHKSVNEDEIAYIALHFNLALEKQKKKIKQKKNIVIVCSTGRGSAELLVYSFEEKFGRYLNEIRTCDLLSLPKMDLSNIDYIITTVPITMKVPVPILEIKYFLEDNDVRNIYQLLNKNESTSIQRYFQKSLFLPCLEAKTKQEVLEQMTDEIKKQKQVPRNFYQCLMKREEQAVTEFGNYVAMPHPYKAVSEETFICIAILNKPILWDKRKVQLVYLFSMSKNGFEDLQNVYRVTSKLLSNADYVKRIIREREYGVLLQLCNEIEQMI